MSHALATLATAQIETLRNGLRIMAMRALGDPDLADDVAQEALLRALNAVTPDCAADAQRLGAFVGGIARHVIADVRRRAGRFSGIGIEHRAEESHDALTRLITVEERLLVHQALAALAPSDREIIHDSFFLGLSPTELAARSGEPPDRIRKRKSRALERLRNALMSAARHDSVPATSSNSDIAIPAAAKGVG
jgi:RNA polymerase sigma factor (sigma-70 family)